MRPLFIGVGGNRDKNKGKIEMKQKNKFSKKEIIYKSPNDIIPYDKNPRRNEKAVDAVANSIREFGFKSPIVVDKYNVIICGHTRHKASLKLGLEEVPVIIADDLTEKQVKAYRLADNKVGELAEWDDELLANELEDIGESLTDFGFDEFKELESDEKYTKKIEAPIYEITGECPKISELVNKDKASELMEEIESANIPEEIKEFLRLASYRHLQFNYAKIAEFYAHQPKEIQQLFENSALVIIDFDKAIEKGFVELTKDIERIAGNEE